MKLASQIATSIRGSLAFTSRAVDLGKIFRKLFIAWQCCGLFELNENFEYSFLSSLSNFGFKESPPCFEEWQ